MSKSESLKNLSNWLPNSDADWAKMLQEIQTANDREAAILISAFLEATLKLALACSFGEDTHRELFEGADAPLSDFNSKIRMAEALGIIGLETRKKLNAIRKIRNAFAHSLKPFDFNHETISQICSALENGDVKDLKMNFDFDVAEFSEARRRFSYECLFLGRKFVEYSFQVGGREIDVFLP